jgi:hypothetical protein
MVAECVAMAGHFINLVFRAIAAMPERIGSNWGGVLFPFLVFVATELMLLMWGERRGRWGRNVIIGFAVAGIAWTGLFLVSAFLTVYDDHQNLVGTSNRFKKTITTNRLDSSAELNRTRKNLTEQLHALQNDCAHKDGVLQTLEKQNRDRQASINGCLSQATKLLTPEPPKIVPLILDDDATNKRSRILLLTNKSITPVNLVGVCDQPIVAQKMDLLGVGNVTGFVDNFGPNTIRVKIDSPAWTPISPMTLTFVYKAKWPSCQFLEQ